MVTIEDRRSKSRQRCIPNSMAVRAGGAFAVTGKAVSLLPKADSKFEEKFTALLLHFLVSAVKSMERVKGIEPSSQAWEAIGELRNPVTPTAKSL